jgi:ribosomal protein L16/L10AE
MFLRPRHPGLGRWFWRVRHRSTSEADSIGSGVGDVFGEMALLAPDKRMATVRAGSSSGARAIEGFQQADGALRAPEGLGG